MDPLQPVAPETETSVAQATDAASATSESATTDLSGDAADASEPTPPLSQGASASSTSNGAPAPTEKEIGSTAGEDKPAPDTLVRADRVEAWSLKYYYLQAVPGWYGKFGPRDAVLALDRSGRVIYSEGTVRRTWVGKLRDLGAPQPIPNGFVAAKNLRLHTNAREQSFVVRIAGKPTLIVFSGLIATFKAAEKGINALRWVPIEEVKDVAEWAQGGLNRVMNPHQAKAGAAAAQIWRSVLDGSQSPESLPNL
jgi:hypothetical protein